MKFSADQLARILEQRLAGQPLPSGYLIAYSGGMDSHVLLAALAELSSSRPNFPGTACCSCPPWFKS